MRTYHFLLDQGRSDMICACIDASQHTLDMYHNSHIRNVSARLHLTLVISRLPFD